MVGNNIPPARVFTVEPLNSWLWGNDCCSSWLILVLHLLEFSCLGKLLHKVWCYSHLNICPSSFLRCGYSFPCPERGLYWLIKQCYFHCFLVYVCRCQQLVLVVIINKSLSCGVVQIVFLLHDSFDFIKLGCSVQNTTGLIYSLLQHKKVKMYDCHVTCHLDCWGFCLLWRSRASS